MTNKTQSYPHPAIDELLALLQEDIFSDAPECQDSVNRVQEIVVELLSQQQEVEDDPL